MVESFVKCSRVRHFSSTNFSLLRKSLKVQTFSMKSTLMNNSYLLEKKASLRHSEGTLWLITWLISTKKFFPWYSQQTRLFKQDFHKQDKILARISQICFFLLYISSISKATKTWSFCCKLNIHSSRWILWSKISNHIYCLQAVLLECTLEESLVNIKKSQRNTGVVPIVW